jgi:protein-disulfide isomerase-like protein with CxxC motif
MISQSVESATMYITLRSYLNHLEEVEQSKPAHQRRKVPLLNEIAADIGLTPTAMSNIVNNNIKQLSLQTGGKIIAAVRARGFPMEVGDLVAYRPAINEES